MPTLSHQQLATLLHPYYPDPTPLLLDQLSTYLNLLTKWNLKTNLTAIRTPEAIVTRHFGESLFAACHLPPGQTLLDLGSGAGFPGLPHRPRPSKPHRHPRRIAKQKSHFPPRSGPHPRRPHRDLAPPRRDPPSRTPLRLGHPARRRQPGSCDTACWKFYKPFRINSLSHVAPRCWLAPHPNPRLRDGNSGFPIRHLKCST